jgi:hypothetical protein
MKGINPKRVAKRATKKDGIPRYDMGDHGYETADETSRRLYNKTIKPSADFIDKDGNEFFDSVSYQQTVKDNAGDAKSNNRRRRKNKRN